MMSATTTNTRCHSIHQQPDDDAAVAAAPSSSGRGGRLHVLRLFGLSNPRPLPPPSKENQVLLESVPFCLLDLFNPLRGSEPLSLEQQTSLAESLSFKKGESPSSSSSSKQQPHHRRDESTLFTEEEEYDDGYDEDEMDAWNFCYIDPQSPSSLPLPLPLPLEERRVSFQKVMCVVEVPSHRDCPDDLRELLWYSADEMDALVERNTREYLVDGRDWRRASEEYVFCCHPLTGELLHPATWMKSVFLMSSTNNSGESSWPHQERRRRRRRRYKRRNNRRQARRQQFVVSSSVWIDHNLFATNGPFCPPPPPKPTTCTADYLVQQHHLQQHRQHQQQLPPSPSNSSISTNMMDHTDACPAVLLPLSSRQRRCVESATAATSTSSRGNNNYYPTTTLHYQDRTY